MLASVLNSPQAVKASVMIVRAFVRMRHFFAEHKDLTRRVARLEGKTDRLDEDVRAVLEALKELMVEPGSPPRKIGFGS